MAKIVQETRYELSDGELLVLRHFKGRELVCAAGEVWITVDGRPEDTVLSAGARWTAPDNGEVVVSALRDSRLTLTRTCHRRTDAEAAARLTGWLRWRHRPLALWPATQLR